MAVFNCVFLESVFVYPAPMHYTANYINYIFLVFIFFMFWHLGASKTQSVSTHPGSSDSVK